MEGSENYIQKNEENNPPRLTLLCEAFLFSRVINSVLWFDGPFAFFRATRGGRVITLEAVDEQRCWQLESDASA